MHPSPIRDRRPAVRAGLSACDGGAGWARGIASLCVAAPTCSARGAPTCTQALAHHASVIKPIEDDVSVACLALMCSNVATGARRQEENGVRVTALCCVSTPQQSNQSIIRR